MVDKFYSIIQFKCEHTYIHTEIGGYDLYTVLIKQGNEKENEETKNKRHYCR